ncbi:MAG: hypothetical protein EPO58_03375 [Chitinophagaceae bacterium]|nr:MAG: hypothetical protein EPO58_03375 [Chitinophagaceae bacterium]
MIITQIIIQSITIIVGLLLFFLIKSYWPKYFETKGTNQATKEDIGEITTIVEEIKKDLLKETELLKAQLSLTNQHRLNIKTAEIEALINLNNKASSWLYYLVRFDFTSYAVDNFREMADSKIEFSKRQYEYDIAQAHVNLFMHDKELLELIREFTLNILKYERRLGVAINTANYLFSIYELKLKRPNANELDLVGEHQEKFMEFYNTYQEESLLIYEIVYKAHGKLVRLLHQRLKQIDSSENGG